MRPFTVVAGKALKGQTSDKSGCSADLDTGGRMKKPKTAPGGSRIIDEKLPRAYTGHPGRRDEKALRIREESGIIQLTEKRRSTLEISKNP